jgi:hypothetical protein
MQYYVIIFQVPHQKLGLKFAIRIVFKLTSILMVQRTLFPCFSYQFELWNPDVAVHSNFPPAFQDVVSLSFVTPPIHSMRTFALS